LAKEDGRTARQVMKGAFNDPGDRRSPRLPPACGASPSAQRPPHISDPPQLVPREGGFGFHEVWKGIPVFLRELDVERMKREAGMAPAEE
jgi:hypothetical protein